MSQTQPHTVVGLAWDCGGGGYCATRLLPSSSFFVCCGNPCLCYPLSLCYLIYALMALNLSPRKVVPLASGDEPRPRLRTRSTVPTVTKRVFLCGVVVEGAGDGPIPEGTYRFDSPPLWKSWFRHFSISCRVTRVAKLDRQRMEPVNMQSRCGRTLAYH